MFPKRDQSGSHNAISDDLVMMYFQQEEDNAGDQGNVPPL